MSLTLLLADVLTLREGISFSSCLGHPDGVCDPSSEQSISHAMSSVPTIMLVWGTIMALMCLVNTYQGLVM